MRHATGRTSPHLVSRQAGVSHLSAIVSLAASEARLLGLHRERLSYSATSAFACSASQHSWGNVCQTLVAGGLDTL